MRNKTYSDEELISMLRGTTREREEANGYLYSQPWMEKASFSIWDKIRNRGLLKDVFQEAIVILNKNMVEGKFAGESSLATYFGGICKNVARQLFKKEGRYADIETASLADVPATQTPESLLLQQERQEQVERAIGLVGEKCRDLLNWYRFGFSNREIGEKLGVNENAAKQQVHQCREKLRERLAELPGFEQKFKDWLKSKQ